MPRTNTIFVSEKNTETLSLSPLIVNFVHVYLGTVQSCMGNPDAGLGSSHASGVAVKVGVGAGVGVFGPGGATTAPPPGRRCRSGGRLHSRYGF